jgi:hypothetical protein
MKMQWMGFGANKKNGIVVFMNFLLKLLQKEKQQKM